MPHCLSCQQPCLITCCACAKGLTWIEVEGSQGAIHGAGNEVVAIRGPGQIDHRMLEHTVCHHNWAVPVYPPDGQPGILAAQSNDASSCWRLCLAAVSLAPCTAQLTMTLGSTTKVLASCMLK